MIINKYSKLPIAAVELLRQLRTTIILSLANIRGEEGGIDRIRNNGNSILANFGTQNGVFLSRVRNANAVIAIGQRHFQTFVCENRGGIGKTEQRMIGEHSL